MGPGSIGVNGTEQVSLPVGDVPETPSAGRRSVRTFTSSLVDRSLRFSAVEILQQEPVSPTESQPMETEAAAGQDRAVRRSAPERERESGLPSPRHDPPVISPGSQAMPAGIAHLDIRTAHAVFTQPHLLTGGTHRGFGSVVCHAACSADASAMAVYQSGTLTLFGKNASGGWEASGGWVVQCPPFIHRAFGSDGRAQRCTGAPFTMLFSRGGQHFVLEDTHGMALYQRMGATWLRWVVPRDSVIYSKKGCALDPSGRWMALCLEGAAINDKEERIPALFIGLWRFFANWGWQARSFRGLSPSTGGIRPDSPWYLVLMVKGWLLPKRVVRSAGFRFACCLPPASRPGRSPLYCRSSPCLVRQRRTVFQVPLTS